MKRVLAFALLAVAALVGMLAWWLGPAERARAAARSSPPVVSEVVAEQPAPLAEPSAPALDETAQRAAIAAPEASPTDDGATSATLVRVRVFASESGEPIEGERLILRPADTLEWTVQNVPSSNAALNESPLTDANGGAQFEVPARKALFLDAVTRSSPLSHVAIPALERGEVREVVLELETELDLVCFVRVVDAETTVGLDGATLRFGGSRWNDQRWAAAANLRADALRVHGAGLFELRARPWLNQGASAAAAGYSRMWFALEEGHATPAAAFEVRLQRAATLDLLVTDRGGASSDTTIEVSTEASHVVQRREGRLNQFQAEDPTWRATTDDAGVAEITTLPPNTPLRLKVSAVGRATYTDGKPLDLAPGERRRVEISLGSGATIWGSVVDSTGQPLASIKVSRVLAQGTRPRLLSYRDSAVASTHSDEHGRFRFDEVDVGSWHIGSAGERLRDDSAALAGLAQVITVAATGEVHDVALTLDRDLYLAGVVTGPDGMPAAECCVSASREDAALQQIEVTRGPGTFRLGPLPAGDYLVSAGGFGPYAEMPPVRARAGDTQLVLQVTLGAKLSGSVVDESGKRAACDVSLLSEREDSRLVRLSTQDGVWLFDGLNAGSYRVVARATGGRIAMSTRLELSAGEARAPIELVLRSGATLELRYTGARSRAGCRVTCDGSQVAWAGLEHDKPHAITVPPGMLELRWNDGHDPTESATRILTLAPGEKRAVTWDGKP